MNIFKLFTCSSHPKKNSSSNEVDSTQAFKYDSIISSTKFPVALATQEGSDRKLAIKIYCSAFFEPHKSYIREKLFLSLSHPNIVKYHFARDTAKIPFEFDPEPKTISVIGMEYYQNLSLSWYLGRFPEIFKDVRVV